MPSILLPDVGEVLKKCQCRLDRVSELMSLGELVDTIPVEVVADVDDQLVDVE